MFLNPPHLIWQYNKSAPKTSVVEVWCRLNFGNFVGNREFPIVVASFGSRSVGQQKVWGENTLAQKAVFRNGLLLRLGCRLENGAQSLGVWAANRWGAPRFRKQNASHIGLAMFIRLTASNSMGVGGIPEKRVPVWLGGGFLLPLCFLLAQSTKLLFWTAQTKNGEKTHELQDTTKPGPKTVRNAVITQL